MFDGPVKFHERCSGCGFDYSRYNVGDGPTVFITLIVGTIVVIAAMILELSVMPPLWLHMLLWVPLTALLIVGTLRLSKGMLLILEHRNHAAEGQLGTSSEPAGTEPQ